MLFAACIALLTMLTVLGELFDKNTCVSKLLNNSQRILHLYEPGYDMVDVLRRRSGSNIVINVATNYSEYTNDVDLVLLSMANLSVLNELTPILEQLVYLDMYTMFLFVDNGENLHEIFDFAMYNRVLNFIAVSKSHLYCYISANSGKCFDSMTPKHLGPCQTGNLKHDVIIDNIVNCTLTVYGFIELPYVDGNEFDKNTGLEAGLIRIILQKLRIAPNFTLFTYLDFSAIKWWPIHVYFGGFGAWPDLLKQYDLLNYYRTEKLAAFVFNVKFKEPWLNILLIFDYPIWVTLLVSLIIVTITWSVVNFESIDTSFIFVLAALISPVPKFPAKHRFLFLSWLIVALLLTNAFLGLLTSLMFKAVLNPAPKNEEELIKSKMKVGLSKLIAESNCQKKGLRQVDRYVCDNIVLCDHNLYNCINRSTSGEIVIAGHMRGIMYQVNNKYPNPDIISEYHVFNYMLISVRSPHRETFQRYLTSLAESGITDHLDKYQIRFRKTVFVAEPQKVALKHLYLIIVVYFVGMLLSCVAFLLELLRS